MSTRTDRPGRRNSPPANRARFRLKFSTSSAAPNWAARWYPSPPNPKRTPSNRPASTRPTRDPLQQAMAPGLRLSPRTDPNRCPARPLTDRILAIARPQTSPTRFGKCAPSFNGWRSGSISSARLTTGQRNVHPPTSSSAAARGSARSWAKTATTASTRPRRPLLRLCAAARAGPRTYCCWTIRPASNRSV